MRHTETGSRPPKHAICDYSDTDYAAFWSQHDRQYEDEAERIALRRLAAGMSGTCLEIGCGFGRLVNEYAPLCTGVLLTDYAENLLSQAKIRVKQLGLDNVRLERADLYDLSKYRGGFDNVVCIRVMHHVENVPDFFRQVNLALRPGGTFILEYANKKNLLEVLRYLFRRPNIGPFTYEPSRRGTTVYYNFHPDYIRDMLAQNGFEVEEELAVSMFRSKLLKKLFGCRLLSKWERLLQKPLARFHPGPSVFLKASKTA